MEDEILEFNYKRPLSPGYNFSAAYWISVLKEQRQWAVKPKSNDKNLQVKNEKTTTFFSDPWNFD